jgi:hypothetical protein
MHIQRIHDVPRAPLAGDARTLGVDGGAGGSYAGGASSSRF